MERVALESIPRPHYLIKAEISEDGQRLRGRVIFPKEDGTVADRKDHVGAGHLLFAIENAGYLMMAQRGKLIGERLSHPLVSKLEMQFFEITPPDEPVEIEVEAYDLQEKEKIISCKMQAQFKLHGLLLASAIFRVTVLRSQ
jgi:hypothetical protein